MCTDLLHKAVYGLPELYAAEIAGAKLIANPGCYPTSVILGLYAAIKNDLVHTDDIVVDAKSGATGAGRKAAVPTLFCEISDNFRAYGLPTHRHTPEIEQELSLLAGHDMCCATPLAAGLPPRSTKSPSSRRCPSCLPRPAFPFTRQCATVAPSSACRR